MFKKEQIQTFEVVHHSRFEDSIEAASSSFDCLAALVQDIWPALSEDERWGLLEHAGLRSNFLQSPLCELRFEELCDGWDEDAGPRQFSETQLGDDPTYVSFWVVAASEEEASTPGNGVASLRELLEEVCEKIGETRILEYLNSPERQLVVNLSRQIEAAAKGKMPEEVEIRHSQVMRLRSGVLPAGGAWFRKARVISLEEFEDILEPYHRAMVNNFANEELPPKVADAVSAAGRYLAAKDPGLGL